MPLPDERPRPSVANLIGKFETQNKRLSLSASSPSRSSSVVSHVTGDSTKEEVKEKREWPPKSVIDSGLRQSQIVSSLAPRHIPAPLITPSTSSDKKDASGAQEAEQEVPLTAKALNASQMQAKSDSSSFLENWRKDLPSLQVESEATPIIESSPPPPSNPITPTAATVKKFTTLPTPRTSNAASKTATSKTPISTSSKAVSSSAISKTPAKVPLKSTPSKQSLQSSTTSPLKPQHTGQSVASSAATKKTATKTSIPPKTPSRPEAAPRAKTPSASRPKTPSSGLFAPTAASLARSRNPPPQMPTPVKKSTLSSSSMDRLSKPTAASQARMATTASAASGSRPTTAAVSRPSNTTKAKISTTPKKEKKEQVLSAVTGAAVVASIATVGLAATSLADGEKNTKNTMEILETSAEDNEKSNNSAEIVDGSSSSPLTYPQDGDAVQDDSQEEHGQEGANPEYSIVTEGEDYSETKIIPVLPPSVVQAGPEDAETSTADLEIEHLDEPTVTIALNRKDDLEDIVNLLESVSIAKPHKDTIENIPDEILEIPDEDEK